MIRPTLSTLPLHGTCLLAWQWTGSTTKWNRALLSFFGDVCRQWSLKLI